MASWGNQQPKCKFGSLCYRKNPDHFREFWHPGNLGNTRANAAQQSLGEPKNAIPFQPKLPVGENAEGRQGLRNGVIGGNDLVGGAKLSSPQVGAANPEKSHSGVLLGHEGLRNGVIGGNELVGGAKLSSPQVGAAANPKKSHHSGVLLLMLIGVPGSGKSTFCSELIPNAKQPWTRICQDIIAKGKRGTKQECLKQAEQALAQSRNVIIDRCNIDRAQRLAFLQLAASLGFEAHGVVLNLPTSICIQRAAQRVGHEGGVEAGNAGGIISRFASTRQMPILSEGFSRITFCRTDSDVEKVVQEYRELVPSEPLKPGVFGAAVSKGKSALQLVNDKGCTRNSGVGTGVQESKELVPSEPLKSEAFAAAVNKGKPDLQLVKESLKSEAFGAAVNEGKPALHLMNASLQSEVFGAAVTEGKPALQLVNEALQSGVFGAAVSEGENPLQLINEKGSNQPFHRDSEISNRDQKVGLSSEGLQQAQEVVAGESVQMEEAGSSCESDESGRYTLAFPSISTADFQFDYEKASTILVEAIAKFLETEKDSKMRLLMVDLTESHMLRLVNRKAREKGVDFNRFLTFVGDITRLRSSQAPACNIIANAANWRLKAGGGGVNAAIHSAAGPQLEFATKKVAQSLTPGTSITVQLPDSSPLYNREGVTHVVHVLGPNMNPQRPNCLSGDYSEGCRILQSAYESLFKNFSAIVRSGLHTEGKSGVISSSAENSSCKTEEARGKAMADRNTTQQPPRNAFTVLMQASKRSREPNSADPRRDKVRTAEEDAPRAGRGNPKDSATQFSRLDVSPACGSEKPELQNQSNSNSGEGGAVGMEIDGRGSNGNEKKWDGWALALYNAAMNPEKHRDDVLKVTEYAVALWDKFPKAKKHLLIVARKPGLESLESLRKEDLLVLRHMHSLGLEFAASYLKEDLSLIFRLGYHSVPSMRQLHLHVISQDFNSESLKKKKHWNSFTTPFFRDSLNVIDQLEQNGRVQFSVENAEKLLDLELRCHRCRSVHPNLPRLKQHISRCNRPFPNAPLLVTRESLPV